MGLAMASRRKLRKITMPSRAAAERVYERMSKDLPINAKVAPIIVKDEAGDNILVFRSLRDDPVAAMHDRGRIDQAQYAAARHWQECYERVEIGGARAIDTTKEAVDGGMIPEPFTESQRRAARDLARAGRALGQEGESIIRDILGAKNTLLLAATRRGLSSETELAYFGKRFLESLEVLVLEFGYANRDSKAKRT